MTLEYQFPPLSAFEINEKTGFVPARPPIEQLPVEFDAWEQIVPILSPLIRSRRLRDALMAMPELDVSSISTIANRERALLILSAFANAWVWGGDAANFVIPRQIAVPLFTLANAMDRPPIVHYASMTLNNWALLDASRPPAVDNLRTQIRFLGGVDEEWFFVASLGVELSGAPILSLARTAVATSVEGSDSGLTALLVEIEGAMAGMISALEAVRLWCDPHIFYRRVRPFLAGWPAPGAIYEGISAAPKVYVGGSAGQSSLIQAIDCLLNAAHLSSGAGTYLSDIRRYMPPAHRRFVQVVERYSQVRTRAASGTIPLKQAYNALVDRVGEFRVRHLALARDYIAVPAQGHNGERGTGGTEFENFLSNVERSTASLKL